MIDDECISALWIVDKQSDMSLVLLLIRSVFRIWFQNRRIRNYFASLDPGTNPEL